MGVKKDIFICCLHISRLWNTFTHIINDLYENTSNTQSGQAFKAHVSTAEWSVCI